MVYIPVQRTEQMSAPLKKAQPTAAGNPTSTVPTAKGAPGTPAEKAIKKQIPATPRKRVAHYRTLVASSAGIRDAIAGCVGKSIVTYGLAQIQVLQGDSNLREETIRFDNDNESEDVPDRPWQTFDNIVSDVPEKNVTCPITVATDVKLSLAILYIGIADLINGTGKMAAVESLQALIRTDHRESNIIQFIDAVVTQMRHLFVRDPLNRDLGYPLVFRQKLEALVSAKTMVDPGAEIISRLYVEFLKAISWHAAVIAYEQGHLTLNRATLFSIIAQMEAIVPAAHAPAVRDVLNLMRTEIEAWETSNATIKEAQKKKMAAKKAGTKGAAPGAKPAAPGAKPAAPGAKPAAPGAKPAAPGAKPAAPSAKPAAPSAKPAASGAKPANPSTDAKPELNGTDLTPRGAEQDPEPRGREPTEPDTVGGSHEEAPPQEETPQQEESPAPTPAATPAAKPVATPTAKPVATPTAKPATAPAQKPATAPAPKPATVPAQKPATAPAQKPATAPAQKSATEPTTNGTTIRTVPAPEMDYDSLLEDINSTPSVAQD